MTSPNGRLCHGRRYQQPYESVSAVWRRFLTVNRGVPAGRLQTLFKGVRSTAGEFDHQLKAWCQSPDIPVLAREYSGPERQCPRCARSLYHCSLFNLPWLQRCPLHDQPLVANCPECSRPWPHRWDTLSRLCPTCGCPSVLALSDGLKERLPPNAFEVLADLDADVQLLETRRVTLLAYQTDKPLRWWALTPNDWAFGALLQAQQPGRPSPTYGASLANVSGRRTHRYRLTQQRFREPHDWSRWLNCQLDRRLRLRERAANLALKHIVDWNQRQKPANHRVQAGHYALLSLADFQRRPPPCPFGLALSLWLDHLRLSGAPNGAGVQAKAYPFLWELRQPPLHDLTPLLCLADGDCLRALPEAAYLHVQYTALTQVFFDLMRLAGQVRRHQMPFDEILGPGLNDGGNWSYFATIDQDVFCLNLVADAGEPGRARKLHRALADTTLQHQEHTVFHITPERANRAPGNALASVDARQGG